jgi:hypothetical protein
VDVAPGTRHRAAYLASALAVERRRDKYYGSTDNTLDALKKHNYLGFSLHTFLTRRVSHRINYTRWGAAG